MTGQKNMVVSIDQMTITVVPMEKMDIFGEEWRYDIETIYRGILARTYLAEMAGEPELSNRSKQKGYLFSYVFNNMIGRLTISYHPDRPDMGICINFSATALHEYSEWYQKQFGTNMNPAILLKRLQFYGHCTKVTRIDIAVDYINYPDPFRSDSYLEVDAIYSDFDAGEIHICDQKGRSRLTYSEGIEKNYNCRTIYFGSRKSQSFLRIYDKKVEQIEKYEKGKDVAMYYDFAVNCKSWVRMEAVFRNEYAAQIGEMLVKLDNDDAVEPLLAAAFSDKYRICRGENPIIVTRDLLAVQGALNVHLTSIKAKDTAYEKCIKNLLDHSNFLSVMLYTEQIYGAKGLWALFFRFIKLYYKIYKPLLEKAMKKPVSQQGAMRKKIDWLQKHKKSTIKNDPDITKVLMRVWEHEFNLNI